MDNNDNIPRLVWERDQANANHTIRVLTRIIVLLIVTIAVVVAAFLYHIHRKDKEWLDFLNDYDFESYEVSTENGGNANYIGRDGVISNGESERQETHTEGRESKGEDDQT